MNLVYQTLGLIRAMASLLVFLAMAYALRHALHRREVKAWVVGAGCLFIGAALYLIPEEGPGSHLGLYVVRNSFLLLNIGCLWVGSLWLRADSRIPVWAILMPLALLGVLLLFLRGNLALRAVAFSCSAIPFLLAAAWGLMRNAEGSARPPARSAALLFVLHAGFYLARAIGMPLAHSEADLTVWVASSFLVALLIQSASAIFLWLVLEAHRA